MHDHSSSARWAVVEAPSALGLRTEGVEQLPAALARLGLLDALRAPVVASLHAPAGSGAIDPATGILNEPELREFSAALGATTGRVIDGGWLPLVLGGDCSILIGNAAALKRRGRFGLLFLDGHADYYQPTAEPTGEAASMDLALVTGCGPALITEPHAPLIMPEDVVAFGFRDSVESAHEGSQPLPTGMLPLDLATVRHMGIEAAAAAAVSHLTRSGGPKRFWVHVDADVLDDAVMPAVDYRLPGGLQPRELATVLRVAMASGRVAGVEVTIYNPTLDNGCHAGRQLVAALIGGMAALPGRRRPGSAVTTR